MHDLIYLKYDRMIPKLIKKAFLLALYRYHV